MSDSILSLLDTAPQWAEECFSLPKKGVNLFLQELCALSGAKYAHIRVLSRLRKYYTLSESIGPYNHIGWRRRFHLLDERDRNSLAYQFVDYRKSRDCQQLEQKYTKDPQVYEYLRSLVYGLWIPLEYYSMNFGYVMLSWSHEQPENDVSILVKKYMSNIAQFIPLLFSACRSLIANNYLNDLWEASSIILSAPTEASCYERLAAACTKLWGPDTTTYVGKPDPINNRIDVVAVNGCKSKEAQIDTSKQSVPWGKGLFSYALVKKEPIVSNSLPNDQRFEYHSMMVDGGCPGSAMASSLQAESDQTPIAVFSVEHERDGYFDDDDIRYLTGLAHISYAALSAHKKASERLSQEIDTLFTQMAHEVHEPLQALINDADVLRYTTSILQTIKDSNILIDHFGNISHRASNILEICLDVNKVVQKHLDAGIDGAATRIIAGRVNLYRFLNSLLDTWEERACTHGVQLNPLYDSLRGIYVQCDESELKSALGHLIGDAIKYSYSGRRQSQGSSPKYGRYVNIIGRTGLGKAIIEFQNLGVGILKHELSSVKMKFVRGELAVKEGRAGTGRGLWIANTFFDSMGGSIEITSEYKGLGSSKVEGPYFTTVKAIIPCIIPEEV